MKGYTLFIDYDSPNDDIFQGVPTNRRATLYELEHKKQPNNPINSFKSLHM